MKPKFDIPSILARLNRPPRAVVTAGMPYANGPLHLGHIAGAHLPADIHARFLGLMIGRENVLFVCGTDDHGSTTELMAMKAGCHPSELLNALREEQGQTLERFAIDLDVYSGTSHADALPIQTELCQDFMREAYKRGHLSKKTSRQWYDPSAGRFLADRLVRGTCPNPKCGSTDAYSDECSACGHQHDPTDLIDPRSALSDATPELRDTDHLWIDMWSYSETLREWVEGKQRSWRKVVTSQILDLLRPSLQFSKDLEAAYKAIKKTLPKHKQRYTADGQVALQFPTKANLEAARPLLDDASVAHTLVDGWAHRSITRDIAWGIPVPEDIDPGLKGKTLYVWPDSLIAPIAFTQVALKNQGRDPEEYASYWRDPDARVYQFLGQDNVYFYVLMQGAMWLSMQDDTSRMPEAGELQMTEVFGAYHLIVDGEKMSKSTGNFVTGDQLLGEKGYKVDQVRYYLAMLGLSEKTGDFDFEKLDERNRFLASKMNAALERPISAAHSKFEGKVPEGVLIDGVEKATERMVARWLGAMQKGSYPAMLFELENYARKVNSLFTQHKPHDDRYPEEPRINALYSAFYVLKNLMIMLYPFVPTTMDRVRESLNLPASVFQLDELGKPIPGGHAIGEQVEYFPAVEAW